MTTNKLSIIILIATVVATSVSAMEFIVGDDKGWTLNVNYQSWANGKVFVVGDKLVFRYGADNHKHNVFKVNETAFQRCIVPPANEAFTSGNDVITLDNPGQNFYICGIGKHCESGGMRLFINVQPLLKEPAPSGKEIMVGDDKGWTLNVDYQAWAKGKEFVVGDKIVFKFGRDGHKHNVFEVNETAFQQCVVPADIEPWSRGNDVIPLTTPGQKWYICGVGKHCLGGMKLFIDVLPQKTVGPSPYKGARKMALP